MEILRVVAAAVVDVDGTVFSLPPPARHHTILHMMYDQGRPQKEGTRQGFLLSDGRYADRYESKRIAVACGQQIERHMNLPQLYSEDVW